MFEHPQINSANCYQRLCIPESRHSMRPLFLVWLLNALQLPEPFGLLTLLLPGSSLIAWK